MPLTMRALSRLILILLFIGFLTESPVKAEEFDVLRHIVISLADRLLYLQDGDATVASYRIAIGRPGVAVPQGETTVVRMRRAPTWHPTANQRRNRPSLPLAVPPGPSNPLGAFALDLGWNTYAIHGTNEPGSIGRRATGGCFRLAANDIATLFQKVAVGTPVQVIAASFRSGHGTNQEASARIPQPAPKSTRSPTLPVGMTVASGPLSAAAPPVLPLPEPLPDPRCRISTAPLRRLICHTPELTRLDGQVRALQAAYRERLGPDLYTAAIIAANDEARRFEEMVTARCWIRRDTEDDPGIAERAVTCLGAALTQRLAAARDRFASAPQPKIAAAGR